jgi:protein-L-isoaspartate(D-aspartate) O-methyltransferase
MVYIEVMQMKKPRLLLLLLLGNMLSVHAVENHAMQRARMVADIINVTQGTSEYTGLDSLSDQVIQAMQKVPRHEFVPAEQQAQAYQNRPLPIGNNQTISQPFIVALMTELADVNANSVVLEIGTGSGYQAAVLAELTQHVYTIEIIEALGRAAESVLQRLGYDNVTVRIGDGYLGWAEVAPFDAILVTAAPEQVPQPLLDQLKVGGRMIIPVGAQGQTQSLRVIEKSANGEISERDVLPVGFVPLTRDN